MRLFSEKTKGKKNSLVRYVQKFMDDYELNINECSKVLDGLVTKGSLGTWIRGEAFPVLTKNGQDYHKSIRNRIALYRSEFPLAIGEAKREMRATPIQVAPISIKIKRAQAIAQVSGMDVDDETKDKLLSVLM